MTNQKGFTVTELIAGIVVLAWIAGFIGVIWVAAHFIAKYW